MAKIYLKRDYSKSDCKYCFFFGHPNKKIEALCEKKYGNVNDDFICRGFVYIEVRREEV